MWVEVWRRRARIFEGARRGYGVVVALPSAMVVVGVNILIVQVCLG